jgi:hypothetical protein
MESNADSPHSGDLLTDVVATESRPAATRVLGLLFLLVAILSIAQRYTVLSHFAFRHTDDDQVLMWYASSEFAHLRFHEPRFFGQNYGTMFEGLMAAPFVALGAPHAFVLPIVTSVLALTPFALLAARARARAAYLTFLLCAALPLAMPLRYHLISSLPRGFVTGAFFASLTVAFALGSDRPRGYLATGFLAVFSVSVLPNAVLLVLPIALVSLFRQGRDRRFLLCAGLGASLAVLLHLAVQRFYSTHAAYRFFSDNLARSIPEVSFNSAQLLCELVNADRHFRDVMPAGLGGPFGMFVVLALPSLVLLLLKARTAAGATALSSLLVLLSLGNPRVATGDESIFYPWSRHFLPLPVLFLLSVLWVEEALGKRLRRVLHSSAALVTILVFASAALWTNFRHLDDALGRELAVEQPFVFHTRVASLERGCRELGAVLEATHTSLVVFPQSPALLLNYGCPVILGESIRTVCPTYDRRTWVLKDELTRLEDRFLLYGFGPRVEKRARKTLHATIAGREPNILLIEGNEHPLRAWMKGLGISYRAY